jgi:NADH:ubiquinone oxidoreductase subunit 5 (subunit L)/multisubunit Na+/H+ antiporter MnhA subunit
MISLLNLFIIIPLAGYLISLLIPGKKEKVLSWVAFSTVATHLLTLAVFFTLWLLHHHTTVDVKDAVLLKTTDFEFFVDFSFDKITAVYMFIGAFITLLITMYSRYYMHRESGYKRFFNTILFFYLGYNITVLAGNLETLFIGWEVLGISSFLLIAFYRERYLPVRNAVKVFSIYRIGDVGLILAIWMNHHLWHENITFLKLSDQTLVHEHLLNHSAIGVFISLSILLAALVKSAQFPFSAWLPRAMEGPTPSSAIFYGSLSVHLGVFMLLRTFPFWENQISVRVLIIVLGAFTSLIATATARVQSSVKSQIAYSSIAQIGLIFIEIALGFENLALFHFAGNAFLRTYQLLVSPSVVTYLIREQFYNFKNEQSILKKIVPKPIEYTLYMISIKEWNLDTFMSRFVWNPIKRVGNRLNFVSVKIGLILFIPAYIVGMLALHFDNYLPDYVIRYLPMVFVLTGLVMVIKSFTERRSVEISWLLVIMNHFWIALAVSFNEHFNTQHTFIYLSGIIASGIFGFLCIRYLERKEKNVDMLNYHGHIYEHPRLAIVFFIACLGLSGFPITPSFVGEDLIFSHIHQNQLALAILTSVSFMVAGLSVIRIYARIFMGPHEKTYHEVAYKSS